MTLPLPEVQAVSKLADLLYDLLPGTPYPRADKNISFPGAAHAAGVGKYWNGGSKKPAITNLIESTLIYERGKFCKLILEIVNRAIKRGSLFKEDLGKINVVIKDLKFKIPELWDQSFLQSLPMRKTDTNNDNLASKDTNEKSIVSVKELEELRNELISLHSMTPQKRGYAFEEFLNRLFTAYKLKPRASFKLLGEQIDGSLEFETNTYLIEAKWQNAQVTNGNLLVFHGKVSGKSAWSRGVYISYSGYSSEAFEAFAKGRATNLIALNGEDLFFILKGDISLTEMLKLKVRKAAEEGCTFIPTQELLLLHEQERLQLKQK